MKNKIILFSFLFVFFFLCACNKNDNPPTHIPDCINTMLEDELQSENLKTIRVQMLEGEAHYWLNTDFMHFDGVEYIVSAECDTVCIFCGECFPPGCVQNYTYEDWLTIWEK